MPEPMVADETLIADLVCDALPVGSPATLLEAIARAWRQTTPDASFFVSLLDDELLVGRFHRDDYPTVAEAREETADPVWSARLATDVLLRISPEAKAHLNSLTAVAFESDTRVVGGILLLGSVTLTTTMQNLAQVCGHLIAQLRQQSNRQADVCQERLRDLKLEALAEFAAGAGHEINNPVATIVGRASLLLNSETDPEKRRALETIGGQAYRIRDMIGDAMTFARPPDPVLTEFPPGESIRGVLESFESRIAAAGISLELNIDETIQLVADAEQFRVVLSCLLRNSLEALETGDAHRRLEVKLTRIDATSDGCRLTFHDNGPGLTESEREHLFDPFFSGRQAGRGLGFGLSRCWQIARMHGGRIHVGESPEGGGFSIHVDWVATLPLGDE